MCFAIAPTLFSEPLVGSIALECASGTSAGDAHPFAHEFSDRCVRVRVAVDEVDIAWSDELPDN